jgi:hypothetical protein
MWNGKNLQKENLFRSTTATQRFVTIFLRAIMALKLLHKPKKVLNGTRGATTEVSSSHQPHLVSVPEFSVTEFEGSGAVVETVFLNSHWRGLRTRAKAQKSKKA